MVAKPLIEESVLEKIHKSALKFLFPQGTTEVYKIIVDEAIKLVSAQYGSLQIASDGDLQRVYTTLPIASELNASKHGFTYTAFQNQKPLVKVSKDHLDTNKLLKIGLKSSIFIPLAYKKVGIGVLVVNTTEDRVFTKRELEILTLFGSLASLAIRKAQLHDEAKNALEMRDLFISMAAHELRTPLTTINGYIQLLKRKVKNSPETTESRWINELSLEIHRLTELVNELLTVNRIKQGELSFDFKEHMVGDIIERAIRNFNFTHPERNITFDNQLQGDKNIIVGDLDKLIQVITNLVDNAVKFSPKDSEIIIRALRNTENFHIQVIDKGKGIPKKDLGKVFEGFYRVENQTEEGMGLGLFLVKNVVDKHRGNIKVYSKEGEGTKIDISLPIVRFND